MSDLTHIDDEGRANMVDVSDKPVTRRMAKARAVVEMAASTADAIRHSTLAKGDVLATARLAGIQAAKRTDALIPLCHSLPLHHVSVALEVGADTVVIDATARCEGKTGVEMEALVAASVAALTIYDMAKAIDRGMRIASVELVEKLGGRSGHWRREAR